MRRRGLIFGALAGALLAGAAVLRLVPMEFDAAGPRDPRVVLGLPAAVRGLELPGLCPEAGRRFGQSFLECGGVCGRRITLGFAARVAPDSAAIRAATGATEVVARPASAAGAGAAGAAGAVSVSGCAGWVLELTFDERAAP